MESVLNRINDRSGNEDLQFLKDIQMKTANRQQFEKNLHDIEAKTNETERGLNNKNDEFQENNDQLKGKEGEINLLTAEIIKKKVEKKRLVQYVIDGEQRYKYEVNKIWFYTVFNIGGIAAVLYMTL